MKTLCIYLPNTRIINRVLNRIAEMCPCFISRKYIETDYSEITIQARQEDMPFIERMISVFV